MRKWSEFPHFFWTYGLEIIAGILMLVGIILSFFYVHVGGALVGLGFGICFFEPIWNNVLKRLSFYIEHGIFKTLMLLGTLIYFLIAIPAFLLAALIAVLALYLFYFATKRKP